jgi:DNA-directed RNA polymerase specialized sigma24 family protein
MSAIGTPKAIGSIHRAMREARESQPAKFGKVRVIVRRRVIDLLKDDRTSDRQSPLPDLEQAEFYTSEPDPEESIQAFQLKELISRALDHFGAQGEVRERQAYILRRQTLEGVSYAELSVELQCTIGAIGLRLRDAREAFRKHIERDYPQLTEWLSPRP